jgi:hypothetical protein
MWFIPYNPPDSSALSSARSVAAVRGSAFADLLAFGSSGWSGSEREVSGPANAEVVRGSAALADGSAAGAETDECPTTYPPPAPIRREPNATKIVILFISKGNRRLE